MRKITFILFIFSGLYAQCEDYNQSQCSNDDNCNWVEDITEASCYYTFSSYSECIANGCSWYNPGTYGYMGSHCYGSYSVDNSYCEEIQMPEPPVCSDIDTEEECSHPFHGDGCQWVEDGEVEIAQCSEFDNSENGCNDYPGECYWDEDITYGSCSGYSEASCNNYEGCYWDCSWWYTWACSCYGAQEFIDTECVGEYEINTGYCTEAYDIGDVNSDGSINVIDIVELVTIILNAEYNISGDVNQDGTNNITDIISLVNIVLGGE